MEQSTEYTLFPFELEYVPTVNNKEVVPYSRNDEGVGMEFIM